MQFDCEIERVTQCAVCHNEQSSTDVEYSRELGLQDPFSCRKCEICGLRWLSPRPTEEGYERLYSNENYFGGSQAQEDYEQVVATRRVLYQRRLSLIKRKFTDNCSTSLLDVGAATGDFVNEAQQFGFDAVGLELSLDARLKAKEKYSLDLYGGGLQEFDGREHLFDIIHMHHVFEHLADPNTCLKKCFRLLASGGLLVLEVPQQIQNDLDRLRKMINKGSSTKDFTSYSLHHTYFYTPETIKTILGNHEFIVESVRTANPANTPLWPFSMKNLVLRPFLKLADMLHDGGNIIEVFAWKT